MSNASDTSHNKNELKGKLPGAFDLFRPSSEIVQKNIKLFAIVYILPLASALASLFKGGNMNNTSFGFLGSGLGYGLLGFGLIVGVVFIVLTLFVQAFGYCLQLRTSQDKEPTFDDIWAMSVKYWTRLIWLEINIAVRVLVGLILLIVPGLRAIRKYYLAPYFMVDGDLDVKETLAKSATASERDPGAIWGVIGVSVLISLISSIPFIGALIGLVVGALYSVAAALRYQQLK